MKPSLLLSARALPAGLAAAVAVVFAAALLVGAPAGYAANTLYVNGATGADSASCGASTSPCRTIQQAINNASSGDVISVAAGIYNEFPSIYKSLTLEGAQAGNPGNAARASESPTTESVVQGMSVGSGATVDGFAFAFGGNQVTVYGSGATIENNVFSGYGNAGGTNDAIGVNASPGTTIIHNYFTSPSVDLFSHGGAVVQWYNGGCSGSNVSDNVFAGAAASALADIYFYCDDQATSTITVSGNTDLGSEESFVNFQHIGGGGSAAITVTNNTVTIDPTLGGASGIYLSSRESGVGTVNISGNSLTGDVGGRALKISVYADIPGQVTVTGNDFSGDGVGAYVGSVGPGGSVTLRANNISNESGNATYVPADPPDGVLNLSGVTVDAVDNWWGCNTGPGTTGCSGVSANVTYDPWLVLDIAASPSTLMASDSSTLTADLTHDSAGADTSTSGTILDGTTIGFATDFGTLTAPLAPTSGGRASVTLNSSAAGTANVSATLDSQTVPTTVTFKPKTPTSADQCKKGGWQSFGIFKNQGDCVSYVATHGKNPPSGH